MNTNNIPNMSNPPIFINPPPTNENYYQNQYFCICQSKDESDPLLVAAFQYLLL